MIATILLAAAPIVAFPSEGARLPAIDKVYLIGSTRKGDTNVVVNGESVSVYRTGAWAAMVDVSEGSNDVSVASQSGESTNVWFRIAKKPVADPDAKPAPPKVWEKLAYAKDDLIVLVNDSVVLKVHEITEISDTESISEEKYFLSLLFLMTSPIFALSMDKLQQNLTHYETQVFTPIDNRYIPEFQSFCRACQGRQGEPGGHELHETKIHLHHNERRSP